MNQTEATQVAQFLRDNLLERFAGRTAGIQLVGEPISDLSDTEWDVVIPTKGGQTGFQVMQQIVPHLGQIDQIPISVEQNNIWVNRRRAPASATGRNPKWGDLWLVTVSSRPLELPLLAPDPEPETAVDDWSVDWVPEDDRDENDSGSSDRQENALPDELSRDLGDLSARISEIVSAQPKAHELSVFPFYQLRRRGVPTCLFVAVHGFKTVYTASKLTKAVLADVRPVNTLGMINLRAFANAEERGWEGNLALLFAEMILGKTGS